MADKFDSDILSDEIEAQEGERRDAELVDHQFRSDFGRTFSSLHGKRVLWRILAECQIWQPVFHGKALEMARREGERNIGLWLLKYISTNLLVEMINENREKESKP